MPIQWLFALAHPTTKDKPSLLLKLKYEMTISDVYDLLEYQEYENWVSHEKQKQEAKNYQ